MIDFKNIDKLSKQIQPAVQQSIVEVGQPGQNQIRPWTALQGDCRSFWGEGELSTDMALTGLFCAEADELLGLGAIGDDGARLAKSSCASSRERYSHHAY